MYLTTQKFNKLKKSRETNMRKIQKFSTAYLLLLIMGVSQSKLGLKAGYSATEIAPLATGIYPDLLRCEYKVKFGDDQLNCSGWLFDGANTDFMGHLRSYKISDVHDFTRAPSLIVHQITVPIASWLTDNTYYYYTTDTSTDANPSQFSIKREILDVDTVVTKDITTGEPVGSNIMVYDSPWSKDMACVVENSQGTIGCYQFFAGIVNPNGYNFPYKHTLTTSEKIYDISVKTSSRHFGIGHGVIVNMELEGIENENPKTGPSFSELASPDASFGHESGIGTELDKIYLGCNPPTKTVGSPFMVVLDPEPAITSNGDVAVIAVVKRQSDNFEETYLHRTVTGSPTDPTLMIWFTSDTPSTLDSTKIYASLYVDRLIDDGELPIMDITSVFTGADQVITSITISTFGATLSLASQQLKLGNQ